MSRPGGLQADPVTLQTPIDWVFAGGDAFYGPKSVVDAVACGKEAAESIHRFVNGQDLKEGREKKWEYVKPETAKEAKKDRVTVRCLDPVWAEELELMQEQLLERLRDRLGEQAPRTLRFRAGDWSN